MKARIKFSKTGSMRFIGHLDVMRYFQKAMRRAGINVSYSQGFSPHQLMSFTSPLGIGLSSDAEYLDIVLEEADTPKIMAKRINAVMNDEIKVKAFTFINDNAKPSMASLVACDYLIALKPGKDNNFSCTEFTHKQLEGFLCQDKIEVLKKTKKSEQVIDIKGHIYYMADNEADFEKMSGRSILNGGKACITGGCLPVLYCGLASGSVINIKPGLVLETFCKFAGIEYNEYDYQVHRLEMYAKEGDRLIPMSEYNAIDRKDPAFIYKEEGGASDV